MKVGARIIEHNPKQLVTVKGKDEQLSMLPSCVLNTPNAETRQLTLAGATRGSDES
ncbi:MAG TPA: hypothetical protein VEF91_00400 [Verrucomicrobiae bacterium]|nr:hypothetical protein [Verrucomicrobiae bacterium]